MSILAGYLISFEKNRDHLVGGTNSPYSLSNFHDASKIQPRLSQVEDIEIFAKFVRVFPRSGNPQHELWSPKLVAEMAELQLFPQVIYASSLLMWMSTQLTSFLENTIRIMYIYIYICKAKKDKLDVVIAILHQSIQKVSNILRSLNQSHITPVFPY